MHCMWVYTYWLKLTWFRGFREVSKNKNSDVSPNQNWELLLLTGPVDRTLCFLLPVPVSVVLVIAVTEELTELQPCHLCLRLCARLQVALGCWSTWKVLERPDQQKTQQNGLCWNCGGSDGVLVRGRVVYTGYADLTTIRVLFKKFTFYMLLTGLCPTSGKVFTVYLFFQRVVWTLSQVRTWFRILVIF